LSAGENRNSSVNRNSSANSDSSVNRNFSVNRDSLPVEPPPDGRAETSVRRLLKRVEARAALGDTFEAALLVAAVAGFFFLLLGATDYRFDLRFKTRLIAAASIFWSAAAWLALRVISKARRRGALWAAALIERQAASLDNQLFTFVECDLGGASIPRYLRGRIEDDLSRKLKSIAPSRLISLNPGRTASLTFFSALVACLLTFCFWPQIARDEFQRLVLLDSAEKAARSDAQSSQLLATRSGNGIEELHVTLTPPAYTGQSSFVQTGESLVAALAGARADLYIKVDRELSEALFSIGGTRAIKMEREGELSYRASFIVSEDSICKIALTGLADPNWKADTVFSVRAVKDNPPEIHITRPASDLLFAATARPESLFIDIAAKDDYGLAFVKLKYIKTTGEGDAARFENGEIRVSLAAADATGQARGSARLDLASIGAGPGTSLVFHAEAVDRNNVTGPGVGYSENIIAQVAGIEPVKISLDDMRPDEALKYLTSERMILIETEKLNRQRAKLSESDFISRSQAIAIEQRRLRESFNQFSELESATGQSTSGAADSPPSDGPTTETEAAKLRSAVEPDIPAGASDAARKMILALRAMWRAEGALSAADIAAAIVFEKDALSQLKLAQNVARYFTKAAARSMPVDLKRRYMGALDDVRSRIERASRKQESAFDNRLRGALTMVYDAARILSKLRSDDPGSNQMLEVARQKADRASEELLSAKGEGAVAIGEAAAKLKLITRMLDARAAPQNEEAFALLTQVASEMAAALSSDERRGLSPQAESISPAVRASGARYFKLLAIP
jgi:hypothetical protein